MNDDELDRRLRDELLSTPIDSSAVERRVREEIASTSRFQFAPLRAAAAIAAVLLLAALALVVTRSSFRPQTVEICSAAARDHVREIVQQEPRHWISDRNGIDALGQRVGVASAAITNLTAPGYHLDRGKLCRLNGSVFLHLVYSNGAREISLFLGQIGLAQHSGDLYAADFGPEHAASVQAGRNRAVVVTGESQAAARSIAQIAAKTL